MYLPLLGAWWIILLTTPPECPFLLSFGKEHWGQGCQQL